MSGRAAIRAIDDPRVVTAAIVALACAALWLGLWQRTGAMGDPAEMGSVTGMSMVPAWSAGIVASTASMWLAMMAAMMLPSMAPMLAVYAGLAAKEDRGTALAVRVGLFAAGYLLLWGAFSVAASLAQLALRESVFLTMRGTLATPVVAGVLLLVAGGWQFTSVKDVCVRHCRSPLAYLMTHWREGTRGAFALGARHGVYCFGCCIAFMGLMFVFGAMNVLWMAVMAAYFLAEKVLPGQRIWGRLAGGVLLAAGSIVLLNEVL